MASGPDVALVLGIALVMARQEGVEEVTDADHFCRCYDRRTERLSQVEAIRVTLEGVVQPGHQGRLVVGELEPEEPSYRVPGDGPALPGAEGVGPQDTVGGTYLADVVRRSPEQRQGRVDIGAFGGQSGSVVPTRRQ